MRGREGEKEGEGEGKRERLFATQGFMSGVHQRSGSKVTHAGAQLAIKNSHDSVGHKFRDGRPLTDLVVDLHEPLDTEWEAH